MRSGRRGATGAALAATLFGTLGLGLGPRIGPAATPLALAAPAPQDAPKANPPQDAPDPKAATQPQDTPKTPAAKGTTPRAGRAGKKGGLRLPGGGRPRAATKRAADPLAGAPAAAAGAAGGVGAAAGAGAAPAAGGAPAAVPQGPPKWPFHYTLKVAPESGAIALDYYPAEKPFDSPVVLLVHEPGQGRSGADFAAPIDELKGKSLAAYLQSRGFAVVVADLRGHGRNGRRTVAPAEWRASVADLQAVYQFLVDRNNRGELNLARLGVVALGESANLVAAWAGAPGGAVSTEGRLSDLGPIVLVSPVEDARGLALARLLPPIAPRFPLYVIAGDRDERAIGPARAAQAVVERHRLGKVAYVDSGLHGTRLMQFVPKIPGEIERFLTGALEGRPVDWEPRYLLEPVPYGDIQLVADSGTQDPAAVANPNAPGRPAAGNRNAPPAAAPAPAANPDPAAPREKAATKKR